MTLQEVIRLIRTHTEHDGSYCDTGADMEWRCRSECVEMAVKRVEAGWRDVDADSRDVEGGQGK
jgi:hypothetical protein